MTTENRELLQRAAGILEGLLLTAKDDVSNALEIVVCHIDKVLEKEVCNG